jgi:hypothetical protein
LQLSEQEGLVVLVTVLPANRVRPKRLCKKSHFVDCRITCLQPEFNARQLPTLALFYLWPLWSENMAGSSRIAKILLLQVDLYMMAIELRSGAAMITRCNYVGFQLCIPHMAAEQK